MTTEQDDPNKTRLLEIYGVIIIIIVLFGGLALIFVIHVLKIKYKQQKRLHKRKPIIANNPDQLLYGQTNLNNLDKLGLY